jgi:hypothetical protein
MPFRIRLTESNFQIERKLTEAALKKLAAPFYSQSNITYIEDIVRQFVKQAIVSSKVWQSLSGGDVKGLDKHFGIPSEEVQERLDTLLSIWLQEIVVEPQTIARSRTFVLSYKFSAIQADWANVLSSEAGVTINESKRHPEGQRLHWLSWLLIEGDQLTIDGFSIDYGNYPKSRSGGAYMRPKLSWRIPTGFGPFSKDNNFVTQQLERVANDAQFRNLLLQTMKKTVIEEDNSFLDILNGIELVD